MKTKQMQTPCITNKGQWNKIGGFPLVVDVVRLVAVFTECPVWGSCYSRGWQLSPCADSVAHPSSGVNSWEKWWVQWSSCPAGSLC